MLVRDVGRYSPADLIAAAARCAERLLLLCNQAASFLQTWAAAHRTISALVKLTASSSVAVLIVLAMQHHLIRSCIRSLNAGQNLSQDHLAHLMFEAEAMRATVLGSKCGWHVSRWGCQIQQNAGLGRSMQRCSAPGPAISERSLIANLQRFSSASICADRASAGDAQS
jgi:hypothetical protein